MGTTYWRADQKVMGFIESVMMKYHHELCQHKVSLGVLFAMSSDEENHALKHHGYPVAACIKVVTLKDRITKGYDAELMIDAEFWKSNNEEKRVALIDHELSHIALKRKKPEKPKKGQPPREEPVDPLGEVVYDDIGRPALKTVKGDYNVGDGFMRVIQRHQTASIETDNINAAMALVEEALNSQPVEA